MSVRAAQLAAQAGHVSLDRPTTRPLGRRHLERAGVVGDRTLHVALLLADEGAVHVGEIEAWIGAQRLAVVGDRTVEVAHRMTRAAAVVVRTRIMSRAAAARP